ncbi:hypothetical protein GCK72_001701 [Caenorhabditis remanei]|uniref:Uncharacterized protein n=1 Tax=Caenorhabditis remanei TaxID=31234 RepID=A0A2P4VKW7_CAERE|nr:hypothetical protein GCK72_001701 [Caenorhabditis remanei]KAF1769884.1 hypothetical protein GCK72_001701 [Caenorhabditis remanei]
MEDLEIEQPKVACGWKGCQNSFANIEGMNVHVQADHMLYRCLVQTEYQGRTHIFGFEHQQSEHQLWMRAPAQKQGNHQSRSNESTPPRSPLDSQAPEIPAAVPILQEASAPVLQPVTPIPSPVLPPVPHSGPMIVKVEREVVIEEGEAPIPTDNVSTSGALTLNDLSESFPSTSSRKRTRRGPGSRRSAKGRRTNSKYWTYTDQMSYRCNVHSCSAEFSSAEAARSHFNSNHDLEPHIPSNNRQSQESTSAPAYKPANKRQKCPQVGCTKYFMSKEALARHFEEMHANETVVSQDTSQDDEPMEDEDHVSDYEREEEVDDEQMDEEPAVSNNIKPEYHFDQ